MLRIFIIHLMSESQRLNKMVGFDIFHAYTRNTFATEALNRWILSKHCFNVSIFFLGDINSGLKKKKVTKFHQINSLVVPRNPTVISRYTSCQTYCLAFSHSSSGVQVVCKERYRNCFLQHLDTFFLNLIQHVQMTLPFKIVTCIHGQHGSSVCL